MTELAHIYRYPVKSLMGESLASVELQNAQPMAGDRRFAIATEASADVAQTEWQQKMRFFNLMRYAVMATLSASYDLETDTLYLEHKGGKSKTITPCDSTQLKQAGDFLSDILESDARGGGPVLIGNNHINYLDRDVPYLSLINIASVNDLGGHVGMHLDPLRFRGNLYIDGGDAFEERSWIGKHLQIGDVIFEVMEHISRCNAVNVNPQSGERDINLLKHMMEHYNHTEMGVLLKVVESGSLQTGDGCTFN